QFQVLHKLIDFDLIATTMLGTGLLKVLDEWTYSSIGITSVGTWLVKSGYWDSIDLHDLSTQVLKLALKGRFLMFLERMLAFGFGFDDGIRTLETAADELLASSSQNKELVDFLRKVGFVVDDPVVDIKKGVFDFSAGVIPKPVTGGITNGGEGNGNVRQHGFGCNVNGGGINGSFVSIFGAEGSAPFSFSAAAIGDSLRSSIRSPIRGTGSRLMTGSRRLGGR
ncbi:hypothetical protein HDU76_004232, partial [Blyttiomyces sp. JEL0837]